MRRSLERPPRATRAGSFGERAKRHPRCSRCSTIRGPSRSAAADFRAWKRCSSDRAVPHATARQVQLKCSAPVSDTHPRWTAKSCSSMRSARHVSAGNGVDASVLAGRRCGMEILQRRRRQELREQPDCPDRRMPRFLLHVASTTRRCAGWDRVDPELTPRRGRVPPQRILSRPRAKNRESCWSRRSSVSAVARRRSPDLESVPRARCARRLHPRRAPARKTSRSTMPGSAKCSVRSTSSTSTSARPKDDSVPSQVRHHESSVMRALIAELARKWQPELLQIEYTHMAHFRDAAPHVPRSSLSTTSRSACTASSPRKAVPAADAEDEHRRWLAFELRWLKAYDGVWTVSEEDRQIAARESGRPLQRTYNVPQWRRHRSLPPRRGSRRTGDPLRRLISAPAQHDRVREARARGDAARMAAVPGCPPARGGGTAARALLERRDRSIAASTCAASSRTCARCMRARRSWLCRWRFRRATNIKVLEALACGTARA